MLLKSFTSPATCMEKSLSKVTVIFELIGIQYISITSETLEATSSTNGLSRKFKWIFVVNILLTICEVGAISFAIQASKFDSHKGNVATGQIVQFTCYYLMIVVIITTMLNSLFLRKRVRQILRNCKIISKTLLSLNQCVDYEAFGREYKKSFAKLFLCFVGLNLAALIFVSLRNNVEVLMWTVLTIYPYFFIVMVFGYWTFLIRLVCEHLRFVKESLVQMKKHVNIFQIDPETRNHNSKMRRNHETFKFFVKLKRIYGVIYETSTIVNEVMAVPISLTILFVVIANVSSGYKVFLSFRSDIPLERVAGKTFL